MKNVFDKCLKVVVIVYCRGSLNISALGGEFHIIGLAIAKKLKLHCIN